MNFLRFVAEGVSKDLKTNQNDKSLTDYSKTAVIARVFAIKKKELHNNQFSWPLVRARWYEKEVLLPNKISAYNIYSSFKQFGAVKQMRFFGQTDLFYAYCWVYVAFYESQSVDAALLKREIEIGNDVLEIKKTKRTFCNFGKVKEKINIDEILLQAPDENSPKNIVNILNDDCLTEIFKHLSFLDQCSVLGVCVRFNLISTQLLAKVAAEQQQKYIFHSGTLMDILLSLPLQQANDYLRNLGSSIHTIGVGELDFERKTVYNHHIFMGMISKHCKNIRTLYLRDSCYYFSNLQLFSELIPLFARLENLRFECSDRYLDSLLPICSQLRVLSLNPFGYFYTYSLPPIKLPKLVAFQCNCNQFDPPSLLMSSLKIFLSLNIQLEAFSFRSTIWPFYDSDSEKHDSVFGQLKRLKFLEINHRHNQFIPKFMITSLIQELLSNNVQIEHLKLRGQIKIDDELIENISQMKTIQKLEFLRVHELKKRHLISLALNLPNLEAMIDVTKNRCINLILFDRNIHRIVKEVQEKMSKDLATLDVQLLKNVIYEHMVEASTIPLDDINEHYHWLSITSKTSPINLELEKLRSIFSEMDELQSFPIEFFSKIQSRIKLDRIVTSVHHKP